MNKYHIYCDESGIVNERYMVLGGIIFNSKHYTDINNIINFRKGLNTEHEIKFEKLKGNYNYELYQNIIKDLFKSQKIQFRCVIFDKNNINHTKYNNSSIKSVATEQGFYKFYYQLIYQQFVKEDINAKYTIYLDERPPHSQTQVNLKSLKDSVNAKCLQKDVIHTLEFIQSGQSNFIQIADLLTGSVNYAKNEKNSKKPYKSNFVKLLSDALNLKNISNDTGRKMDWKVWNLHFRQ